MASIIIVVAAAAVIDIIVVVFFPMRFPVLKQASSSTATAFACTENEMVADQAVVPTWKVSQVRVQCVLAISVHREGNGLPVFLEKNLLQPGCKPGRLQPLTKMRIGPT
jgi:hypothetical protein